MALVCVIIRGDMFLAGAGGVAPRQARWTDERPNALEFPSWSSAQAALSRLADADAEGADIIEEGDEDRDERPIPYYAFNDDGEQVHDYDFGDDD